MNSLRTLTAGEVAARIPLPRGCRGGTAFVERLFREDTERGLVERVDGGWRITERGFDAFASLPADPSELQFELVEAAAWSHGERATRKRWAA